jgi:hypothetical protein
MKKQLITLTLAILGFTATAQVPNYVPTNGLVGWWPFNGNPNDESGNGNNGTVNGATLTTDRFGNSNEAYFFDGDDFIKVNSIFDYPYKTVNCWFKANEIYQFGNDSYQILSIDSQSLSYGLTSAQIESGFISLFAGGENAPFFQPIDSNQWCMLTLCRNLQSTKCYINGVLLATNISGGNTSTSNDNEMLMIGVDRSEIVQFFKGLIDDFGIWNRELNSCEIADIYHSQLGYLSSSSSQTQTALDSYTWPVNGQTYTQSGQYTATLLNAAGCDSIVTLDLTLSFTGIDEINSNATKKLLKITDLNGKETPFKKNSVLLFIYEDGTVERVYEGE